MRQVEEDEQELSKSVRGRARALAGAQAEAGSTVVEVGGAAAVVPVGINK